ncbi:hypothetical protein BZA77DRAFT_32615 [Pyronema omphalodes]|nr:hypothetical protein BZA77DRAFT_32615 [Pyronema omphalodes]
MDMLSAAVLCILLCSGKLKIKLYLIIVTFLTPVQLHTRPSRTGSCLCIVHPQFALSGSQLTCLECCCPFLIFLIHFKKHNLSSVSLRTRLRLRSDI